MLVDKMASNASIEISVIDGNKFEQLFPLGKPTPDTMHCLESCIIVYGNEGRPLLHSDEKSHNRDNGKILIPIQVCLHALSECKNANRVPRTAFEI